MHGFLQTLFAIQNLYTKHDPPCKAPRSNSAPDGIVGVVQSLHWDGVLQDVGKLRDSLPPPAQMVSSVSTPRSDGQTKVWPQEHRSASGTQALAKSSAQRQVDLTR